MTPHDLDLIERFIAAFNAIDLYLEGVLSMESNSSFRNLVDVYAKRHRWWRDGDQLRVFAGVRNVIVHDKTEPYKYVCVPTPESVADIEAIRDRLINPAKAVSQFRRDVVTITPGDSLTTVLKLIEERQYSQFPVCEQVHGRCTKFVGLLTENGITRWLAHHAMSELSLIELNEVLVSAVLPRQDKRPNYQFAAQDMAVEEIAYLFHENMYLEAVLITQHGGEREKLLGIVTRGDILRMGR